MMRAVRWTLTLLIGVTLAAMAAAGPILGAKQRIPDEFRCLAGIRHLHLTFAPIPTTLRDWGLDERAVMDVVRVEIGKAGVEIVEQPQMPRLNVSFRSLTDGSMPDARGFVVFFELYQSVHLNRLELDLELPTATVLTYGITTRQDMVAKVDDRLKFAIKKFVDFAARATQHATRGGWTVNAQASK